MPFLKLLMPLPKSPTTSEMRPRPNRTSTTRATMIQCQSEQPPIVREPPFDPVEHRRAPRNTHPCGGAALAASILRLCGQGCTTTQRTGTSPACVASEELAVHKVQGRPA